MAVILSMLRGVNVGGHGKIKMDALRALYTRLELRDVQTYVQSGNVIFRTEEPDHSVLTQRIQDGIEQSFGFRPEIILRTLSEMKETVACNPFAGRAGVEPSKLLVHFLASDPGQKIRDEVLSLNGGPEELRPIGRELYIYFPNGMGRPKLSWAKLERLLQTPGTGRNWNSVMHMLAFMEQLEASE